MAAKFVVPAEISASPEHREVVDGLTSIRQRMSRLQREREDMVLRAHHAGLTTRAIGELVGVSSGTVSIWIRLAKRSHGVE